MAKSRLAGWNITDDMLADWMFEELRRNREPTARAEPEFVKGVGEKMLADGWRIEEVK